MGRLEVASGKEGQLQRWLPTRGGGLRESAMGKRDEQGLGVVAHTCNPSTLGRLKWADHLSPGVQDQPGQHGETMSLQKKKKKEKKKIS